MDEEAQKLMEENGGAWGEHPSHTVQEWMDSVANSETRRGYWQWVASCIEADVELEG